MSEIQDLKNYILSVQEKINNLTIMLQNHSKKDDNLNEILNLIHTQNFEKSRFNQSLFENVFPDLTRRIAVLENKLLKDRQEEIDKEISSRRNIHQLNLKQRTINCLEAEGIYTIYDLTSKTKFDLLKNPNFGRKSLKDVEESLIKINLKLKG